MPTNYTTNPDATTSLTGWSKAGGGTLAFTTEGGLWKPTAAAYDTNKLTITVKASAPGGGLLVSGLRIRRNTASSGTPYCVVIYGGDGSTGGTGVGYYTTSWIDAVDFPVGAFITLPNLRNAYRPYAGESGAKVVIYGDRDGKALDLTITSVDAYLFDDAPVGAQIDSNDAEFGWTQADNSLTATFAKTGGNEGVSKVTWAFGDGTAAVTGAAAGTRTTPTTYVRKNPQGHTFPARGRYTVSLTTGNYAYDIATAVGYTDEASTASSSQVVTVPMGPFVADFGAEINYLVLNVDASPSVSPTLDPIDVYTWAWGDGTTSTGKSQTHTYAQPGDYAVSLTISTNATQRSHTTTKAVTGTTPPNPANYFTVSKQLLQVTLAPSITNGSSYAWTFGDGSSSALQSPTYAYAVAGTYTISLTVNGTLTTSQTLSVSDTYKALKITDALRLEVAVPPAAGVIYNRLKNPDGVKGAWGWQTPLTGSTVIGSSTSDQPKDKAVSGAKLIYTSSGTGTQVLQSTPVAVTAGQYVGAQFVCTYVDGYYRATVDALNASGAVVGASTQTGYLGALGTAQRTVGYLLPATAVAARLRINHYSTTSAGTPSAGTILQLRHLMLVTAATAALTDAAPYAESENWQNVLGSTTDFSISREALNVGTFSARIADSALDPATSGTIRPGQSVRLRVAVPDTSGNVVWQNLYAGTLTDAKVSYVGKRPSEITSKSTRIALSAVDAVTRLAQDPEPRGVALVPELPELLESTTVPYEINGSSGQVPTASIVAYNENASVLDQVSITRDTAGGYAYVNRNNVLVVRDPQSMPTAASGVVDETTYSAIDATFDTGSCMNSITIKWLRYTPATVDGEGNPVDAQTEEILYGPYENAASIETWGFHPAMFTMQGVENAGAIAAKANAILTANATPAKRINSVTVPIRYVEDLTSGKALLDLYDLVQLSYARTSTSQAARVYGITHTVTPTSWTMSLEFAQNGAAAAPQFTPSPPPPDVSAPSGGGSAATTTFAPTSTIAATNVQDAIAEVVSDAAVAQPFASYWKNADQSVASGAWTDIPVQTALSPLAGGMTFNATTGVATVPKAGRYLVAASVRWAGASTGARGCSIVKGSTNMARTSVPFSTENVTVTCTKVLVLVAGDTVKMQGYQSSGSALVARTAEMSTFLDITYLGA